MLSRRQVIRWLDYDGEDRSDRRSQKNILGGGRVEYFISSFLLGKFQSNKFSRGNFLA